MTKGLTRQEVERQVRQPVWVWVGGWVGGWEEDVWMTQSKGWVSG